MVWLRHTFLQVKTTQSMCVYFVFIIFIKYSCCTTWLKMWLVPLEDHWFAGKIQWQLRDMGWVLVLGCERVVVCVYMWPCNGLGNYPGSAPAPPNDCWISRRPYGKGFRWLTPYCLFFDKLPNQNHENHVHLDHLFLNHDDSSVCETVLLLSGDILVSGW